MSARDTAEPLVSVSAAHSPLRSPGHNGTRSSGPSFTASSAGSTSSTTRGSAERRAAPADMTHARLRTVALVDLATWTAISWMTSPALDSYGDMVENYAWSQTWSCGTFRHPPLFAWMVGAWFSVFPTEVWAYHLFSYLNAGLGIVGIVWLARLWLPDDFVGAASRRVRHDGRAPRTAQPSVQQPCRQVQCRHGPPVTVAVDGLCVLRRAARPRSARARVVRRLARADGGRLDARKVLLWTAARVAVDHLAVASGLPVLVSDGAILRRGRAARSVPAAACALGSARGLSVSG